MPDATGAPLAATPRHRHTLLKVEPRAWSEVVARHPFGNLPILRSWADRSWPVIVRRAAPEDVDGAIAVGVPLPPSEGKLRIALSLPPAAVIGQQSLPSLADVAAVAPPSWHAAFEGLWELGARFGVAPACYGSLCWEFLTGLHYVTPSSDLDVLWPATADTDLCLLLEAIAEIEGTFGGLRVDGEVVLSGGRAVNWRELYKTLGPGGPKHAVVKTIDGACLMPASALLKAGSPP